MNYLKIILISLFALFNLSVYAQRNGVIVGNVRDVNTKESIPGATIVVEGTEYSTVSDIDGSYKLSIPVGTYNLKASFLGYQNLDKFNIVLTTCNTQIVNYELLASSSYLQVFVVTFIQNKIVIDAAI